MIPLVLHVQLLLMLDQYWNTVHRFLVLNIFDIDTIENVPRTFTRKLYRLPSIKALLNDERLNFLNLHRLEVRCIYTDLIFMYK